MSIKNIITKKIADSIPCPYKTAIQIAKFTWLRKTGRRKKTAGDNAKNKKALAKPSPNHNKVNKCPTKISKIKEIAKTESGHQIICTPAGSKLGEYTPEHYLQSRLHFLQHIKKGLIKITEEQRKRKLSPTTTMEKIKELDERNYYKFIQEMKALSDKYKSLYPELANFQDHNKESYEASGVVVEGLEHNGTVHGNDPVHYDFHWRNNVMDTTRNNMLHAIKIQTPLLLKAILRDMRKNNKMSRTAYNKLVQEMLPLVKDLSQITQKKEDKVFPSMQINILSQNLGNALKRLKDEDQLNKNDLKEINNEALMQINKLKNIGGKYKCKGFEESSSRGKCPAAYFFVKHNHSEETKLSLAQLAFLSTAMELESILFSKDVLDSNT